MTVDEYLAQMEDVVGVDPESGHYEADKILVSIIRERLPEFAPVLDAYDKVGKWYA